jgi:hypothetical protein
LSLPIAEISQKRIIYIKNVKLSEFGFLHSLTRILLRAAIIGDNERTGALWRDREPEACKHGSAAFRGLAEWPGNGGIRRKMPSPARGNQSPGLH